MSVLRVGHAEDGARHSRWEFARPSRTFDFVTSRIPSINLMHGDELTAHERP